jgi:predicted DNA-binding ribbon-helix-helix protein
LSEQFQNLEKQKHTTLSEQSQNLEKQKHTTLSTIPKSRKTKTYNTVRTIPKSRRTKIYHTVRTISKSNIKIIVRVKIDTTYKQIHNHSLSLFGTDTSIKSGEVKLVLQFKNLEKQKDTTLSEQSQNLEK